MMNGSRKLLNAPRARENLQRGADSAIHGRNLLASVRNWRDFTAYNRHGIPWAKPAVSLRGSQGLGRGRKGWTLDFHGVQLVEPMQ